MTQTMTETLTTAADGRTALRMRTRLAHPPGQVWRALTDPAVVSRWFPAEPHMDLRTGGRIRFVFRHGGAEDGEGEITDLDEPRLLAYTWSGDHLRWELEPESFGSALTLIHTFSDRPAAASYAAGWETSLAALDPALDGRPIPAPGDPNALHEKYVAALGLDQGSSEDTGTGWRVRFERQLTQPVGKVWRELLGEVTQPEIGGPVPFAMATLEFPAGPVAGVDSQRRLGYYWICDDRAAGTVRWELAEGTGHGARLVLTHSGRNEYAAALPTALRIWREHIEEIAARLAKMPRKPR
jgi:uncharacterized protein YndB with AHSA1/START domain